MSQTFRKKIKLPVSAEKAFAWHERQGAFSRLTPPWENVKLISAEGGIRDGARVEVRVQALGPIRFNAVYRHVDYIEGKQFVDIQEKGPFRKWRHEHRFHAIDANRCVLEDHIEYRAPPLAEGLISKRLEKMFRYRHAITLADLTHEHLHGAAEAKMVLVSGASGMVGRALTARLTTRGHKVRSLSRSGNGFRWDPTQSELADDALDGVDAVVHLAGESIAKRWDSNAKKRILNSRVDGTQLLVDAILKADKAPVYVAASGINYYGTVRNQPVHEKSESGNGFLSEVCRKWEETASPLEQQNIRSVFLRTGIVLSSDGGALAKMLPPFLAGLGGRIGSGKQKMSWIALDDLVEMFLCAIEDPNWSGAINAVAPEPVDNQTFTTTLGTVLRRPTLFPIPALAIKALFGEMGRETVLSDLSVQPERLKSLAYAWRFTDLEAVLRHTLGKLAE